MEITEIEEYIAVDRGIVFQAGKRAWLRQLPIYPFLKMSIVLIGVSRIMPLPTPEMFMP